MSTSPMLAVTLTSGSLAEDAGYRTAADISVAAARTGLPYRLVGGLAVSLLHAAHGSPGDVPPRQTADADLGADDQIIVGSGLSQALRDLGYAQTEGNRFVRGPEGEQRVIDVLIPTPGDRLESNIPRGDLTVDAVPGLRLALDTSPMTISLSVRLSTGGTLDTQLDLPAIIPALVLKSYALNARYEKRDLLDLWKLLETAHHLGIPAEGWEPIRAQKRDAIRVLRGRVAPTSALGATMARRHQLPHARIAALIQAHVPNGHAG